MRLHNLYKGHSDSRGAAQTKPSNDAVLCFIAAIVTSTAVGRRQVGARKAIVMYMCICIHALLCIDETKVLWRIKMWYWVNCTTDDCVTVGGDIKGSCGDISAECKQGYVHLFILLLSFSPRLPLCLHPSTCARIWWTLCLMRHNYTLLCVL